MTAETTTLRILLNSPDETVSFFVRDLCAMAERVTRSAESAHQAPLSWVIHGESIDTALPGPPSAALLREVGQHRAQWVAANDPTGRIRTTAAVIEVGSHGSSAVVRTFNYPLKRCTDHSSGTVVPFDALFG